MPPPDPNSTCVIHRDRRATYMAQGIRVCTECWQDYRFEYDRGNNTTLRSRPFLQRLIKASADRFDETHADAA